MPMVETSVAVATPSTTAARISSGSSSAGMASTRRRPISRGVARRADELSSRRERHQASPTSTAATTRAGSKPPANKAEIETPVTEPIMISTRLGGMVSLIAADAASMRDQLALMGAAPLHFREQHGRHRRHVRRLGARNAGNQVHRRQQRIGQAAPHVPA